MFGDEELYCAACSGSGEGQYDGSTCDYCHGTGMESGVIDNEPDGLASEYEEEEYEYA